MFRQTQCCGVKEYVGLTEDGATVESVMRRVHDGVVLRELAAAFIIFTAVGDNGIQAGELAEYIIDNNLGQVMSTPYARNPNTGRNISVIIYTVDHERLALFFRPAPQETLDELYVRGWGDMALITGIRVGDYVSFSRRDVVAHNLPEGTLRFMGFDRDDLNLMFETEANPGLENMVAVPGRFGVSKMQPTIHRFESQIIVNQF